MRCSIRSACVVSAKMEPMINAPSAAENPTAHGQHNHQKTHTDTKDEQCFIIEKFCCSF